MDPANSPVGSMLLRALSKYEARVYPGPIVLLRAPLPDDEELSDDHGWRDVASGGLEIYETPSQHQTIFESGHVSAIAERLDACLRMALSNQIMS